MADPDGELTLDEILAGRGGGSAEGTLDDLVGGNFLLYGTDFVGRLMRTDPRVSRPGQPKGRRYRLVGGGRVIEINSGSQLVDPTTRQTYSVQTGNKTRGTKISESDFGRALGLAGVGTGTGRTQAEEDLTRAQAADIAESQRLARERLELERQQLAENRRQNLLSTARSLIETREQSRRGAREIGASLAGNDPFRLTGSLQGVALGPDIQTPYDIFKTQVGAVATQEVPPISPNATIQDLESAIGKLSGNQPSVGGVPFGPNLTAGFAAGGSAEVLGPYEARLVGEQGSMIAPGTEVMITGGGQTTILPLQSGMQTGGTLTDFQNVSLGTFPSAFRNLRRSLGVPEDFGPLSAGSRARLGFAAEGGGVPIGEAQFGKGFGQLGSPLTLERGLRDLQKSGLVDEAGVKRLTELIGYLPSPRSAAVQLRSALLNPAEKESLISAYRLAGVTPDVLQALLDSANLTGAPRSAVRIGA